MLRNAQSSIGQGGRLFPTYLFLVQLSSGKYFLYLPHDTRRQYIKCMRDFFDRHPNGSVIR